MPDSQRKQAESALTDGLICWLACHDLSGQPHAVRAELAHRIVEQLKRDHQAGQLGLPLNAAERLQLAENAKLLMESWAIELSKQFVALPAHQRDPFVDQLLVNIDDWGLRKWLFPASATELSTSQVQLTQTINAWIARASEEDRSSLREFVKHIQYRVIVLQLRRWLPGRDRA
jgi:hypothetical protein